MASSSSNGSVFSETLQEITNTKLHELSKRRSDFETTKSNILSMLEGEKDSSKRLYILSQGVKACYALKLGKYGRVHNAAQSRNSELEIELKNLDCFLAQTKYDPSVSTEMMHTWEESLLRHLDMQSLKYQYASLYAQLVTEWISTEKPMGEEEDDVAMTEGFEDVSNAMKQQARDTWESTVFAPANVDEDGLKAYLNHLFGIQDAENPVRFKPLEELRREVAEFEVGMSAHNQFNPPTLKWVAEGLLTSGLLSDEQREVLRDFKNNHIILSEIADVLNMRITSLDSWSWGSGVPMEQQRKITAVYNILMHEDLLQALFLQYIGIKWSVFLKETFKRFRCGAWKSDWKRIPKNDAMRRAYYLGREDRARSVQSVRSKVYSKNYFMAHLMDNEAQRTETAEGEEEAEYQAAPIAQMPAAPRQAAQMQMQQRQAQAQAQQRQGAIAAGAPNRARGSLFGSMGARMMTNDPPPARLVSDYDELVYDTTDDEDDSNSTAKRPMDSKQRLLRLLSTEITINTKLYGELTAFHSMFENWNSLLPHETILTVLSFLGVSATWLGFFRKFLKAPLKFREDDPSTPARTRCRGTPASHALSDMFGESILFCLDLAVNQSTNGAKLFRMHDDFWFWSRDHSVAVTAWKSVTEFVNTTGTYINPSKTGTIRVSQDPNVSLDIHRSLPEGDIRWGFLRLSPQTGKFEIDQAMVDKHIVDLRKQLNDKRKSIISFIQAWNTYVATFFAANFGKPANCFGQDHVAQMLATHQRIQREVFSPSSSLASGSKDKPTATNIVEYLKNLMKERFGISNIPDAYLFFPMELGGLDLKSPFISILQVHDTVLQDPTKTLDIFLEAEKDAYNRAKLKFEKGYVNRGGLLLPNWQPENKADRDRFMGFDEYTRYREDIAYGFEDDLHAAYNKLLEVPKEEDGVQNASARILSGIGALAEQRNLKGIRGNWDSMEPYWRWVAQLYGPEVMDRFGGLNIVEPGLLPMGMVSIFRDKRVKWQG